MLVLLSMARKPFTPGQKVKVVKIGKLGGEWSDWAEIAYEHAGLNYPDDIATVETDDGGGHMSVVIVGAPGIYIDHRHFKAI